MSGRIHQRQGLRDRALDFVAAGAGVVAEGGRELLPRTAGKASAGSVCRAGLGPARWLRGQQQVVEDLVGPQALGDVVLHRRIFGTAAGAAGKLIHLESR